MTRSCLCWVLALVTTTASGATSGASKAGICGESLGVARSVFADPMMHAQSIFDRAKATPLVTIDHQRLEAVSKELSQSDYQPTMPQWNFPPYPGENFSLEQIFEYDLVLSSINFMYLDTKTGKTFSRGAEKGAGLLASILTEQWPKISAPGFLANLDLSQAQDLFTADSPLPNISARVRHLNSVGKFLDASRGSDRREWLKRFPRALDLAVFVHQNIDGFEDPFLKRAQLFVGMFVGRFYADEKLPSGLRQLEGMTIYADYILPMVLRRLGILNYATALARRVDEERMLNAGTPGEIEIRASTILAAEELRQALNKTERFLNAPLNILAVDATLWLPRGEIEFPGSRLPEALFVNAPRPHHRTQTTDY